MITVAVLLAGGLYAYTITLALIVMQTNPNKLNCRQGNILNRVDRQARFTVLSTRKKVVGIVHYMKRTKESDGDY